MPDIRRQLAAHGGLYTASELAAHWGITPQGVRWLMSQEGAPAPVLTSGGRALFLADEADSFRNRDGDRS